MFCDTSPAGVLFSKVHFGSILQRLRTWRFLPTHGVALVLQIPLLRARWPIGGRILCADPKSTVFAILFKTTAALTICMILGGRKCLVAFRLSLRHEAPALNCLQKPCEDQSFDCGFWGVSARWVRSSNATGPLRS